MPRLVQKCPSPSLGSQIIFDSCPLCSLTLVCYLVLVWWASRGLVPSPQPAASQLARGGCHGAGVRAALPSAPASPRARPALSPGGFSYSSARLPVASS